MTTMFAIGYHTYGSADVLEEIMVPKPTLSPSSVLIRVVAAGVNPADWRIRNGQFRRFMRLPFPIIPGADVAGVVTEVGADVTRFRAGDAVYAMLPANVGGCAEFAAADEGIIAHKPANLTFAEAAAVPLTALTALQALRGQAQLSRDADLLINGASGGVGSFAVQIAKAMGARVTAATSGRNAAFVRSLGADAVRDYTQEEIAAGPGRYDVVFDAANAYPFPRGLRALRRGGVLVSVNPLLGNPPFRLLARLRGRRLRSLFVRPSGVDLETLNAWLVGGQVRPVIARAFPLAEVAAAHRESEAGRVRGKLVLIVDERLAGIRAATGAHAHATV